MKVAADEGPFEGMLRDANVRARERVASRAAAERLIEKTALDRAWVLTRLQENVERSMQAIAVRDADGNETGVYQNQPMAANKFSTWPDPAAAIFFLKIACPRTIRL